MSNTPPPHAPQPSRFDHYTPQEIAAVCGLSRRRVYDWLSWGWLRGHRSGGRWVIAAPDWEYFAATCRNHRGRLMPSLRDWPVLWAGRPAEASLHPST